MPRLAAAMTSRVAAPGSNATERKRTTSRGAADSPVDASVPLLHRRDRELHPIAEEPEVNDEQRRCQFLQDWYASHFGETESMNNVFVQMAVGSSMAQIAFSWVAFGIPYGHIAPLSATSLLFFASWGLGAEAYRRAANTDAGRVPDEWAGDPQHLPKFMEADPTKEMPVLSRKKDKSLRYCRKEHKFKPDRAHFCSNSGRLVLKMDHYCPWMHNVIGYYNYKYFVQSLVYLALSSDVAATEFIKILLAGKVTGISLVVLGNAAFMATTTALAITPYAFFHLSMLCHNMSTIEYVEKRASYANIYDIGIVKNLQSVLGLSLHQWVLPLAGPPGDGIVWEHNKEKYALLQELEVAEEQLRADLNRDFGVRERNQDVIDRAMLANGSVEPPITLKGIMRGFGSAVTEIGTDMLKSVTSTFGGRRRDERRAR